MHTRIHHLEQFRFLRLVDIDAHKRRRENEAHRHDAAGQHDQEAYGVPEIPLDLLLVLRAIVIAEHRRDAVRKPEQHRPQHVLQVPDDGIRRHAVLAREVQHHKVRDKGGQAHRHMVEELRHAKAEGLQKQPGHLRKARLYKV